MTTSTDDPTGEGLPPEHPASDDTAVSAGDALSDRAWRPDANVQEGAGTDASTDRQPDVEGRPPAEGGTDVPPPDREQEPEDDDRGVADDIEQFLDVDPPQSPASESGIPAPPG